MVPRDGHPRHSRASFGQRAAGLFYDLRHEDDTRTIEWLDPATATRSPAVDRDRALASLGVLRDHDAEGGPSDPALWPVAFDPAGRRGVFLFDDDIFLLELASSQFVRVTDSQGAEELVRFAPNGERLAFVRDNDLYVCDIERRIETRPVDGSAWAC